MKRVGWLAIFVAARIAEMVSQAANVANVLKNIMGTNGGGKKSLS